MIHISVLVTLGGGGKIWSSFPFPLMPASETAAPKTPFPPSFPPHLDTASVPIRPGCRFRGKFDLALLHRFPCSALPLHLPSCSRKGAQDSPRPDISRRGRLNLSPLSRGQCQAGGLPPQGSPAGEGGAGMARAAVPLRSKTLQSRCGSGDAPSPRPPSRAPLPGGCEQGRAPLPPRGRCSPYCSPARRQ